MQEQYKMNGVLLNNVVLCVVLLAIYTSSVSVPFDDVCLIEPRNVTLPKYKLTPLRVRKLGRLILFLVLMSLIQCEIRFMEGYIERSIERFF